MRAELFCYNVPRSQYLLLLLLLSAGYFLCNTMFWDFLFNFWGKITFVLKQTEKERECLEKTKLGDHNCITNYFFLFFNFFKALFFDNTI